jgi:hypothetical protein
MAKAPPGEDSFMRARDVIGLLLDMIVERPPIRAVGECLSFAKQRGLFRAGLRFPPSEYIFELGTISIEDDPHQADGLDFGREYAATLIREIGRGALAEALDDADRAFAEFQRDNGMTPGGWCELQQRFVLYPSLAAAIRELIAAAE